tara:strand:+ start:3077 stop:3481 length:405 start_codon:yes stop_codon:yes gene_type:complete
MPSIRKRIGYLPSVDAQEMITKLANKQKLSQSKVVGILVEEALKARKEISIQNTNNTLKVTPHSLRNRNNIDNSSILHNEIDELISDTGIIYNIKNYKHKTEDNSSETREIYNSELFEQFKQFIQFQKSLQEKS